eukprot:5635255-Prymnesium_polylepis.1
MAEQRSKPPRMSLCTNTRSANTWDAKFRISKRAALAAVGRFSAGEQGPTWVATFKENKSGEAQTLRFKMNQSLASVQQSVSEAFKYNHIAQFFVKDKNGWEMPIVSDTAMESVLKQWEESTSLRTQAKFEELIQDIERRAPPRPHASATLRPPLAPPPLLPASAAAFPRP